MPSLQNDFKTVFSKSYHHNIQKIALNLYSQSIEGWGYVRTYALARVYVCSLYLVGGGLTIKVNIPLQELEGQRGEGLIFSGGYGIMIQYPNAMP